MLEESVRFATAYVDLVEKILPYAKGTGISRQCTIRDVCQAPGHAKLFKETPKKRKRHDPDTLSEEDGKTLHEVPSLTP